MIDALDFLACKGSGFHFVLLKCSGYKGGIRNNLQDLREGPQYAWLYMGFDLLVQAHESLCIHCSSLLFQGGLSSSLLRSRLSPFFGRSLAPHACDG